MSKLDDGADGDKLKPTFGREDTLNMGEVTSP